MKKRVLILIMLLMLTGISAVRSQNTLMFEMPGCVSALIDNVVCTAVPGNKYVSFHRSGTESYFLYFDQGTFYQKITMSNSFTIKDVKVFDDTVYFCGKYHPDDTIRGIFGRFPLSLFSQTTGFIWFEEFTDLKSGEMVKLDVYRDPVNNLATVVLKGWDYTPSLLYNNSYAYIVQVNGTTLSGSKCSIPPYEIGGFAVTDDYIVVSALNSATNNIYLVRVDKANISAGNYKYYNELLFNRGIGVERLDNNDVAVYDVVFKPSTGLFYDRIYTIDMSLFTHLNAQEVPLPEKSFPDDMVYLDGPKILLMLQRTNVYNNNHSYVYYLNPYNNSYTADIEYIDTSYCYNLDKDTYQSYITVTKSTSNRQMFYIRDVTTPPSQCLLYDNVDVTPEKISLSPMTPIFFQQNYGELEPYKVTVKQGTITIYCQD